MLQQFHSGATAQAAGVEEALGAAEKAFTEFATYLNGAGNKMDVAAVFELINSFATQLDKASKENEAADAKARGYRLTGGEGVVLGDGRLKAFGPALSHDTKGRCITICVTQVVLHLVITAGTAVLTRYIWLPCLPVARLRSNRPKTRRGAPAGMPTLAPPRSLRAACAPRTTSCARCAPTGRSSRRTAARC